MPLLFHRNHSLVISKFKNRSYWKNISAEKKLSEEFIREFADRVDWEHVSGYHRFSEEFIREFAHRINWYLISLNQKIKWYILPYEYRTVGIYSNLLLPQYFQTAPNIYVK